MQRKQERISQRLAEKIRGAAIAGLKAQLAELDADIAAVQSLMNGSVPMSAEKKSKKVVSTKTRKLIAANNRRRWAAWRAEHSKPEPEAQSEKPKHLVWTPEMRAAKSKQMKRRYKLFGGLKRPKNLKKS